MDPIIFPEDKISQLEELLLDIDTAKSNSAVYSRLANHAERSFRRIRDDILDHCVDLVNPLLEKLKAPTCLKSDSTDGRGFTSSVLHFDTTNNSLVVNTPRTNYFLVIPMGAFVSGEVGNNLISFVREEYRDRYAAVISDGDGSSQ